MVRSEKIAMVQKLVDNIREYDKQREIARSCFGFDSESKLGEAMSWIVDVAVNGVSVAIEDSEEWLHYFLWEREPVVHFKEVRYPLDSVENLIDFIDMFNRS